MKTTIVVATFAAVATAAATGHQNQQQQNRKQHQARAEAGSHDKDWWKNHGGDIIGNSDDDNSYLDFNEETNTIQNDKDLNTGSGVQINDELFSRGEETKHKENGKKHGEKDWYGDIIGNSDDDNTYVDFDTETNTVTNEEDLNAGSGVQINDKVFSRDTAAGKDDDWWKKGGVNLEDINDNIVGNSNDDTTVVDSDKEWNLTNNEESIVTAKRSNQGDARAGGAHTDIHPDSHHKRSTQGDARAGGAHTDIHPDSHHKRAEPKHKEEKKDDWWKSGNGNIVGNSDDELTYVDSDKDWDLSNEEKVWNLGSNVVLNEKRGSDNTHTAAIKAATNDRNQKMHAREVLRQAEAARESASVYTRQAPTAAVENDAVAPLSDLEEESAENTLVEEQAAEEVDYNARTVELLESILQEMRRAELQAAQQNAALPQEPTQAQQQ